MGVELLTISKYLFHSESVRVIKDYNTLVSLIFVLCYYYVLFIVDINYLITSIPV